MPELPEVETLKKDLAKAVVGRTVADVTVKWPKLVKPLSPTVFSNALKNKKIKAVARRGKMLILGLRDGNYILIHLKMTGQLIFVPKRGHLVYGGHPQKNGTIDLPNKYTRGIVSFQDGTKLFFNDLRKFGWMRYVTPMQLAEVEQAYGVEPLTKEFTLIFFRELCTRFPNRPIKQLLMDQHLIAGIGNIYADESCFSAKVLPMRAVKTLTPKEISALYQSIPKVLRLSISKKGTSFSDYVQLDGKEGKMVKWLNVYNKKNQHCKRCPGIITKIKLNGRGTHFCPQCQQ